MSYGLSAYGAATYGGYMAVFTIPGTSIEERIERALFKSVAALLLDDEPPFAWPNKHFPPASTQATHIRVLHLPNVNTRLFLKGDDPHLRQGILQLTAVTPLRGGPDLATTLAATIADQYPADRAIYEDGIKIRVQRAPDVLPAERTDVSWDARIDIFYECLI